MTVRVQDTLMQAFEKLGLEFVPGPSGRTGGDTEFAITDETLSLLKEAKDQNKHIIVHSDGTIDIG